LAIVEGLVETEAIGESKDRDEVENEPPSCAIVPRPTAVGGDYLS